MKLSDRRTIYILRAIFFLSGFTGLTFEVLWVRRFANIFGSTSVAMAWVFGVFILCLALGGLLAARVNFSQRKSLIVYGVTELVIGLTGLAVTIVTLAYDLELAKLVYWESETGRILLQIAATFLFIAVPTSLMGATLPIMMGVFRSGRLPEQQVTIFYGLNTVGGAVGALATGYILIWKLGVTGAAVLAFCVTLVICTVAISTALRLPKESPLAFEDAKLRRPLAKSIGYPYLVFAFISGFTSIGYELLWGRVSRLYFGERSVATSTLLCIYLLSMAIGSLLVKKITKRLHCPTMARRSFLFAAFLVIAAVTHLIALRAIYEVLNSPSMAEALTNGVFLRVILALAIMVVPVAVLGLAFPFVLQSAPEINQAPARVVGWLYFVNSIGAFLGAMFGGYLAPKVIGTIGGFLALSVVLALVALVLIARYGQARSRFFVIAAAFLSVGLAALALPSDLYFKEKGERIVAAAEDEYGIHVITEDKRGLMLARNYATYVSYYAGLQSTNLRQEVGSYFPCLLATRCESYLNIGTGYGTTVGAMTNFAPSIVKSIETVELDPFIFGHQGAFKDFNFTYWQDPRVKMHLTDGRRMLAVSERKFDVISVNPSDMYVPGSASFFSTDFWEIAKSKLAPGGVYVQLLWGPHKAALLKQLNVTFPLVIPIRHTLRLPKWADLKGVLEDQNSIYALCFSEARTPEMKMKRLSPEIVKAMKLGGVVNPQQYLATRLEEGRRLQREGELYLATVPSLEHTDDHPVLEWAATGDNYTTFDSITRWGTGSALRNPWGPYGNMGPLYPRAK